MSKKRRTWQASEKLEIVQDAELLGTAATARKHGVSSSMIDRWKKKYEAEGVEGLQRSNGSKVDAEKKNLIREIERLRQVVADQAVVIRIKDELLKKTKYR